MISILQNYICTNDQRLNLIKSYFPGWKKQFASYKFFVNYNHTLNYDVIKNLYKEYIPNYELCNDLEKDWGKTTLRLVEKIDTKYILVLIEDFEIVNVELDYFDNAVKEMNDSSCNYALMHKLKKYLTESFKKNYEEKKFIYTCEWNKYPAACMSIVGIFETQLLKKILNHYISQDRMRGFSQSSSIHGIHTPNNFEDFYSTWNNNYIKVGLPYYLKQFNTELKVAIPKREVILHNEGEQSIKQREVFADRIN